MSKSIGEEYGITPEVTDQLVKSTNEVVDAVLHSAGVRLECDDPKWMNCRVAAGIVVMGVFMNGFDHASAAKKDEDAETV